MGEQVGRPPDFESYVVARRAQLRRTAYLLCGDWHRAEDVVQDTLARLYVHWRRASRAHDVDAYVRRSLVNTYLAEGRRPWRRERSTADVPETAYADESGTSDSRDELRRALAGLGPSQRAIVVLRYWDGLSVEETAEAVGCSTGNVKSQSARASTACAPC
ncbi:MAG: SigE family RNA polymerase sigma factor [Candidatus Nanopelagicales bacterium]